MIENDNMEGLSYPELLKKAFQQLCILTFF